MSEMKSDTALRSAIFSVVRNERSFGSALQGRAGMRLLWLMFSGLMLLILVGCLPPPPKFVAGNLNGVNHTKDVINYFVVSGHGGPNIQPYGYGGGACCMPLPLVWVPNIILKVQWETDPNPRPGLPRLGSPDYPEAYKKHAANYRSHIRYVELPPYEDRLCALEVHFMPCHQIELSTSCWRYPSPDSPIKEPQKMQEPAVCPK